MAGDSVARFSSALFNSALRIAILFLPKYFFLNSQYQKDKMNYTVDQGQVRVRVQCLNPK
jgi:hypothetical protein